MASNKTYMPLTEDSFQSEVLESTKPVLMDFWADWCGPCHMIAPVIEELAAEFEGNIKVGKLDVDSNPRVSMQYGIRSIPTLLLFKDGQVVDRVIGVASRKEIADKLNALLETV